MLNRTHCVPLSTEDLPCNGLKVNFSMSARNPISISLFRQLKREFSEIQSILCSKATLVHLSHTLEDIVLRNRIPAMLFTGFQESSHWRKETERYRELATVAQQMCIFAGKPLPPDSNARWLQVELEGDDPLRQEWFLLILSPQFSVLLCGQDQQAAVSEESLRQFETFWTFDPVHLVQALESVEAVLDHYAPDKAQQLRAARMANPPTQPAPTLMMYFMSEMLRFQERLQQRLHANLRESERVAAENQHLLVQTEIALAEKRASEERIKQLYADLGRRADELEHANKELETFTYSVSHDLRAPLRALDGFSHLLLKEYGAVLPADAQKYLDLLRTNASEMTDLIEGLLEFSRLTRIPINRTAIQPRDLIQAVVRDLQPALEGRSITWHIEDLPEMFCDPILIKQVYMNLLSNAVKFTAKRQDAQIAIGSLVDQGKRHYFVRDNGVGFDMQYAQRLFVVFQRLHKASEYEGTGVGLAIVQRIIHRHGGRVWAESKEDEGATFFFTLG
jgi:signal transduction histidine kinase